jgi:hypothetical protein
MKKQVVLGLILLEHAPWKRGSKIRARFYQILPGQINHPVHFIVL